MLHSVYTVTPECKSTMKGRAQNTMVMTDGGRGIFVQCCATYFKRLIVGGFLGGVGGVGGFMPKAFSISCVTCFKAS